MVSSGINYSDSYSHAFLYLLPNTIYFEVEKGGNPPPQIFVNWSLENLILYHKTSLNLTALANVVHIGDNFMVNYTFTFRGESSWLNSAYIGGAYWNVSIDNITVTHLLDSGYIYKSSFNAFYIDGVLSKNIGPYDSVHFQPEEYSPSSFEFVIVTADYTNIG